MAQVSGGLELYMKKTRNSNKGCEDLRLGYAEYGALSGNSVASHDRVGADKS